MKNVFVSPKTRSLVYLIDGFFVYTQKIDGDNVPVLILNSELKQGEEMPNDYVFKIALKNGKVDFLINLHKERLTAL